MDWTLDLQIFSLTLSQLSYFGLIKIFKKATTAGFEPTRAKPNRFQVCLLNHSDTLSVLKIKKKVSHARFELATSASLGGNWTPICIFAKYKNRALTNWANGTVWQMRDSNSRVLNTVGLKSTSLDHSDNLPLSANLTIRCSTPELQVLGTRWDLNPWPSAEKAVSFGCWFAWINFTPNRRINFVEGNLF